MQRTRLHSRKVCPPSAVHRQKAQPQLSLSCSRKNDSDSEQEPDIITGNSLLEESQSTDSVCSQSSFHDSEEKVASLLNRSKKWKQPDRQNVEENDFTLLTKSSDDNINKSSLQYSPSWRNSLEGLTSESFLEARDCVTKRHSLRKQEIEAKLQEEQRHKHVTLEKPAKRTPEPLSLLLTNHKKEPQREALLSKECRKH
ncbi:uncharacterized protein LOC111086331 [Limulus polyphemus]|uniref:Uncharacterized protein LOC111086331 n=1 Tax=Limulus polyphemus TaxID=6850 RepID=A0ABM1SLH2_LIMPO|nr:uncharacterized protein LOC111086331 [Limulus polyphemus]